MIDRQNMLEEQLLRENIRRAIRIVKNRHNKDENYVRTIVRHLIKEEITTPRYEYDALIQLGHLMSSVFGSTEPKKSGGKFAFKESFIDLVSNPQNRETFVEFILDFSYETMNSIDAGEDIEDIKRSSRKDKKEDEIEIEEPEKDDTITVSVGEIPGGDLSADRIEDGEEEFTLGEAGEGIEIEEEIEEENQELKNYSERAYAPIESALIDYYQLYEDNPIEDEIILDTTNNAFIPDSEKREVIFPAGTITERDLFKIFYKVNVLSWAGRYNNEYFNENPVTDVTIASPGEVDFEADEQETELKL